MDIELIMANSAEKPGHPTEAAKPTADEVKRGLPETGFSRPPVYISNPKRDDPDKEFLEALGKEYPPLSIKERAKAAVPKQEGLTIERQLTADEFKQQLNKERAVANLQPILSRADDKDILPVSLEGNSISMAARRERVRDIAKILRANPNGKGFSMTVEDQGDGFAIFKIVTERIPGIELRISFDEKRGYLILTGEDELMPEAAGLIRRLVEKTDFKRKKK